MKYYVELIEHFKINGTIYTEEGLHRPVFPTPTSSGDQVPEDSVVVNTFYDVTPRKGHELDEMELPLDILTIDSLFCPQNDIVPRALKIQPEDSLTGFFIFGWIDDIEPVATKGPFSNVRIKWHVDYYITGEYWRFMAAKMNIGRDPPPYKPLYTLGQGRFKRGPESLKRPEPSSPRLWLHNGSTQLPADIIRYNGTDFEGPFVIFLFTHSDGATPPTTTFRLGILPVDDELVRIGEDTYQMLGLEALYTGIFEERLLIPASSIVGVWVTPTLATSNSMLRFENPRDNYGYLWISAGNLSGNMKRIVLPSAFKTDDDNKYIVQDPLGTVYATLPWGLEFSYIRMGLDVGTSGAWLILFFTNSSSSSTENPNWEEGEGREVKIPLPTVPVASNEYGEYVLTGQRAYDMNMAQIQQQQNLKSGVANSGNSAIGGLVGGAMAGGPAGAIVGAVGGWALGTVGAFVNTAIQEEADRKSQEQTDRLMANQTSNVIINSGGMTWYRTNRTWQLIKLSRDPVSSAELAAEHQELGYVTDTYAADCSAIVSQGGGIRIEGLEVKGSISPEGRRYISALFARGVHLDLIS